MIKASIISIGNEVVSGQIVDNNSSYLSGELLSINIPVVSFYSVGDDIERMVRMLNLASDDADIVLATGGLGPTDDDVTRQAFAKFLGCELELQNEFLDKIRKMFASRERPMPERNKIQAYIPAGTKAIENNLGTAVGIRAELKGKLFFVMPGVPFEMRQMFEESVFPELKRFIDKQAVIVLKLMCFGAGESDIAEKLGDLMHRGKNPLINCTVQSGIVTLQVVATAEDRDKARKMAEKCEKMLRGILGELVYGTGEQTLAEVVGTKLAQQKKTIAVAESCTGGILAKLLTDVPGASRYFTCGWVTYSNAAKINELGVGSDLIRQNGAVSFEVAEAMTKGAREKAGTDFSIGITGIAGPSGGSEQKPVGLVYIGIASDAGCETKRFVFAHNRDYIRLRAAQTALNMLRLKL